MTQFATRTLTLLALAACAGGGVDATSSEATGGDPLDPTGSSGSPSDDGTQVGGEGTEPTPTCPEEDGLPLTTAFEDGTTVAEALDGLDTLLGELLWFDEREEPLTLSVSVDDELRIDGYCNHLVDADVVLTSPDGEISVDGTITLFVSPDYVSGRLVQADDDWLGSLDDVDVLGESCILGAQWSTFVAWHDDVPDGAVRVGCNPWSGGGGPGSQSDDTALNDTGLSDTGSTDGGSTDGGSTDSSTDGGSTATSTRTGTTTTPNTGGQGNDTSHDPQLGGSVPVVSW